MKISYRELKDKILGCWWGKTAGGTIGAPFECYRGCKDLDFYVQDDPSGVPNDDLDLQLMVLRAVEKYGNRIDAHILAEYWLTYVSTSMAEYGAGKNNLRHQLPPPLSGSFNNVNRNSCGAFIRSEMWACLCPGNPDLAVRYAMEDAMIDHGKEGVYGEVFCAAVESQAFVESDIRKLLEKGLGYIPEDSGMARGVRCVIDAYDSGLTWKEARKVVLKTVPGSFGMLCGTYPGEAPEPDIPPAEHGYDAPSNVALGVLGLLYGEKDFGRTLCFSAGCMEDADCTAGFAAAALGIILGHGNLPKKWIDPLGHKIVTWCLRIDSDLFVPQTVEELSARVLRLIPAFLGEEIVHYGAEGFEVEIASAYTLFRHPGMRQIGEGDFPKVLARVPDTVRYRGVPFDTYIQYENGPTAAANSRKKLKFCFYNNMREQQSLEMKWHVPEGVTISPASCWVSLDQAHGGYPVAEREVVLEFGELSSAKLDLSVEVITNGRYTKTFIPIVLLVE